MCEQGGVDPRGEFDAYVFEAFEIMVSAEENGNGCPRQDYTPEEIERLFFLLMMAVSKLKRVPGGEFAAEVVRDKVRRELERRSVRREINA